MLTSEDTSKKSSLPLPVSKERINMIKVCVPLAFKGAKLYTKDNKIVIKYN